MSIRSFTVAAIIAASSIAATTANAQLIRDSFTYQGTLNDNGGPANGLYDITFIVYEDEVGGVPITNGSVTVNNVEVTDGLFSTEVQFFAFGEVFNTNTTRWMELRISESGQPGTTILEPRQKLVPATLANYALRAGFAQNSGTSLNGAYQNDNTLYVQDTFGPVNIQGLSGAEAVLNFNNSLAEARLVLGYNSNQDTGYIDVVGPEGFSIVRLEPDLSIGGGGYLSIARNNSGNTGIVLEGNNFGTEDPYIALYGNDRSIFIDAGVESNSSVVVPNNSISATEMFNEPGVAETINSGSVALTQDASVTDVVSSITIQAPTSGFVLLIASAELTIEHTAGATSSVVFGLSPVTNGFPSNLDHETRINPSVASGPFDFTVTTHAVFAASQGSNTYYLLGDLNNTAPTTGTVLDQQLSAIFIPTTYGSAAIQHETNLPDEYNAPQLPMNAHDIQSEQIRSLQADNERQQRELEEMRAVVEQMNQRFDDQNQRQSRD